MTKKQFYIILSVLLVAILIFSNPSEEVHIQSVKSKLKMAFKKKMSSEMSENQDDTFKTLGNGLGLLLGDTFIDKLTDGIVSRENYLLFSLTNANYKGEEKTIGFGILGNVFLTKKIENIFKQNQLDNQETNTNDNDNQHKETAISDEEFKKSIPLNNENENKYEFTAEMLIDRKHFVSGNGDSYEEDNKDSFCIGKIIDIYDNFSGIEIKLSEPDIDFESQGLKNGDTISVYFSNVEYNGKSKMCQKCSVDFKNLVQKGKNVKFKVTSSINSLGLPALQRVNYLSYIKEEE